MENNLTNTRTFKSVLKTLHLLSVICVMGGFFCMLFLLLKKAGSGFDGTEVIYDKTILGIFNTIVVYGSMLLAITFFIYSTLTEWGFFRYRFIIIKWIITVFVFIVSWYFLGSAISGMASISDAGLHQGSFNKQYFDYGYQALISLIIEIMLLIIATYVSIRKPFGKRNTKPFRHRKLAIALCIPILILGMITIIRVEIRHNTLRNTPISDIDIRIIDDGEYIGKSTFGNYTYKVKVTVEDHQIVKIQDIDPRDSVYVTYATGVFKKIVEKQSPNVDAISGATTTSKAFMKATENALENTEK